MANYARLRKALAQVLLIATVFQLLSSLSAVAVPKLAGQLVDVAIKSDQTPVPDAQITSDRMCVALTLLHAANGQRSICAGAADCDSLPAAVLAVSCGSAQASWPACECGHQEQTNPNATCPTHSQKCQVDTSPC